MSAPRAARRLCCLAERAGAGAKGGSGRPAAALSQASGRVGCGMNARGGGRRQLRACLRGVQC
jgi:hypothetical protein